MKKPWIIVLAGLGAWHCSASEEGAAVESAALSGNWSGQWTFSFTQDPPPLDALSLLIQDNLVVGGRVQNEEVTILDREILFDDRRNGVVYDEGDRLFRTNFVTNGASWSLGFVVDASGTRALVGDFFTRVGAIQLTETIPSTPVVPSLDGRWSGRFAALDNPNPDDAEVEIGDLVLECAGLQCSATGDESFTITFSPSDTAAWAGTVDGLVEADALISVRAVATPDGQMLAVGACAGLNDFVQADLFCAYAALSR